MRSSPIWRLLGTLALVLACGASLAAPSSAQDADPSLVADIRTGAEGSDPGAGTSDPWPYDPKLPILGRHVLFSAWDEEHGIELWRSDGTAGGTKLVKDIVPGPEHSLLPGTTFASNGRRAIFSAATDAGWELWATDGTAGGTRMIYEFIPGPDGGQPYDLVLAGDTFYFGAADTPWNVELWRSDGTTAGTRLVEDIRPGPLESMPMELTAVGSEVYFFARDVHGRELWKSDGTAAGTHLVEDVYEGTADSDAGELHRFRGGVLFSAVSAGHGPELWISDGTADGTYEVKDIVPGNSRVRARRHDAGRGPRIFRGGGRPLAHRRNRAGHRAGCRQLPAGHLLSRPFGIQSLGRRSALCGPPIRHTKRRRALAQRRDARGNAQADGHFERHRQPEGIDPVQGELVFVAGFWGMDRELWTTDGTEEGTTRLAEIVPGEVGAFPDHLTPLNGALVFAAQDPAHGRELWRLGDITPEFTFGPGAERVVAGSRLKRKCKRAKRKKRKAGKRCKRR